MISSRLLMAALLLLGTSMSSMAQPGSPPAVVLPAEVVIPTSPGVASPAVQPPGTAPTGGSVPSPGGPSPVPPGPPVAAETPPIPPAGPVSMAPLPECPALDEYMRTKYDVFFSLTRLVDSYTLSDEPPSPPLNQSYLPLTILAPSSKASIQFLFQNGLNLQYLAENPLQSVLLAPTLSSHFVKGYFPASALPSKSKCTTCELQILLFIVNLHNYLHHAAEPVETLCGSACGPVQFMPTNPVRVQLVSNATSNVTITTPNVIECPGQWVVHEVDGLLYTQVTDPLQAAAPALDLSYALNGEWNTFPIAGKR